MSGWTWRSRLHDIGASAAVVAFAVLLAGGAWAANNLSNHGGPTMQNQTKLFFVYWLSSGVVLDTGQANGVGNFETLLQRFAGDVSGTPYLNIVTQYPGQCGSNQCVLQNRPGAVALGGNWVDTTAYPHAGTQADPLQDSDIRASIGRAVAHNHWTLDSNSLILVITGVVKNTGKPVEECEPDGANCTFRGSSSFCAYHNNFNMGGNHVRYGYLSDASFATAGCAEGIRTATNGQLSSDREVVLMTHEFIEAITDPLGNSWWDSASRNEIGDNCNQIAGIVNMGPNRYAVQQQWSNASSSCVTSFGPSVQFTIRTGDDDLRGDSSATAALERANGAAFETVTLKTRNQPSWNNSTGHIAVSGFNQPTQTLLGRVALTLGQHGSFPETPDNWDVQSVMVRVLSPTGVVLCQQFRSGNPFARLTGSVGTVVIGTSACLPPAQPITFDHLVFAIRTGGDDLRGDSSATASVSLPGSTPVFTLKAESDGSWGNNSLHTKTFGLNTPEQLSAFGAISVRLTSHNHFPETDDNWNIQAISVTATGPHGNSCVINESGNPFARLTGSGPSVALHPRAGC